MPFQLDLFWDTPKEEEKEEVGEEKKEEEEDVESETDGAAEAEFFLQRRPVHKKYSTRNQVRRPQD
eukprot:9155290-Pyramimonas_sp.AAC.1